MTIVAQAAQQSDHITLLLWVVPIAAAVLVGFLMQLEGNK
jgi:hypothetical protein